MLHFVENTLGIKNLYQWHIANEPTSCRRLPYDYPITDAGNVWGFLWESETNLDFSQLSVALIRDADNFFLIPSISLPLSSAFSDYVVAEDGNGNRYLYFRGLISSGGLSRFVIGIHDVNGNEMLSYFTYVINDPSVFSLGFQCGGSSVEIGSTIDDAYDCAGIYYGKPQNVIEGNANLIVDNTTEVWGGIKTMPASHQVKKFNNCKVRNVEFSRNIKITYPTVPEEVKEEIEYILSSGQVTIDGEDWLLEGTTSFENPDIECFCMYQMSITLKSCPCSKAIGCGVFNVCKDTNGVILGSVVTFEDGTTLTIDNSVTTSVSYLSNNPIVSIANANSGFLANLFGSSGQTPGHTNDCQCFVTVALGDLVSGSGCTAIANLIIDGVPTSIPITPNVATTTFYPLGTIVEFVSLTVNGVTGTSTAVSQSGWNGYYSINGNCVASVDSLCLVPPALGNPLRIWLWNGAAEASWTLAQWNSIFGGGGTPFTSSIVVQDSGFTVVELYGGSNVTINGYFNGSSTLYGIEDLYGIITSASNGAVSNCTLLGFVHMYGLTSIAQSFMANSVNSNFPFYIGVIDVQIPSATSIGQGAFFSSQITGFLGNNVSAVQADAFAGSSVSAINLPIATGLGTLACAFCPNLAFVYAPNALSIGQGCFNNDTSLSALNLSSAVNFGGTAGDNTVFSNIYGIVAVITVPTLLQTINGGNPDGDLVTLITNNPASTINYV